MIKSAIFVALLGTACSAAISLFLQKFLDIPTVLIIQNTAMHLGLFVVLAAIYLWGKTGTVLSSILLAAIVVRLLACLVYVVILRYVSASVFLNASIHFLSGFVVFTVLDIRFAIQVVNASK